MIQHQSILKVSDNSGAKEVKCIKVLGGFKKKYASVGDTIIVSVQKLRNKLKKNSKVKKKDIYKALIIRTKTKLKKKNGFETLLNENSVVLMNKQENPIGTRIIGFLPNQLKKKQFQKFITISAGLI
jgi:large subunit ribosomal protein L14